MNTDKLERLLVIVISLSLVVYGLASLGSAAFESFSWKEVGLGLLSLTFGAGLLVRTTSRRSEST